MTDIISAIDQATGCQQCGKPLERSVSDDFRGEGCQQAWHAKRADSLKVTSAEIGLSAESAMLGLSSGMRRARDYIAWTLSA